MRGNGLERKIQSCQETVTDAAMGDAEERTAGRRAGVSRSAPHLNAGLNLAGEEERNCRMNTEKLSLSLSSPPSEPCELLEASPETLLLLLLLLTERGCSRRLWRRQANSWLLLGMLSPSVTQVHVCLPLLFLRL